jgi:hypothetical protein
VQKWEMGKDSPRSPKASEEFWTCHVLDLKTLSPPGVGGKYQVFTKCLYQDGLGSEILKDKFTPGFAFMIYQVHVQNCQVLYHSCL